MTCYLCGDPRTCYRAGIPLCDRCALVEGESISAGAEGLPVAVAFGYTASDFTLFSSTRTNERVGGHGGHRVFVVPTSTPETIEATVEGLLPEPRGPLGPVEKFVIPDGWKRFKAMEWTVSPSGTAVVDLPPVCVNAVVQDMFDGVKTIDLIKCYGGWIAHCHAGDRGFGAAGATPEEAIADLREVMRGVHDGD